MTSLTASNQSNQSPASLEIKSCQTRCTNALQVIRLQKNQPTEMSAGSKDYRAVLHVLTTACNNLDVISTKFTVTIDACIQQLESSAWAAALCKSVDNACEAVISSGTVAAACSCGRHLRKDLLTAVETVVVCLEKQLKMAENRLNDPSNLTLGKQLIVLTGQVASACKNVTLLPKSNKSCLKRRILTAFKQMNDNILEQKEMIEDSMESPRVDVDATEDASLSQEDMDSMFFDYDFTLSLEEIETSRECLIFSEKYSLYLQKVALIVGKHVSDRTCTSKAIECIDDMGDLMTKYSLDLNELGVCLCPPQKLENILELKGLLVRTLEEMYSCLEELLVVALFETSNENDRQTLVEEVKNQLLELVELTK